MLFVVFLNICCRYVHCFFPSFYSLHSEKKAVEKVCPKLTDDADEEKFKKKNEIDRGSTKQRKRELIN